MLESKEMKWVRQVRDEISIIVKEMTQEQRIEYLKEQSKKAKDIMGLKSTVKV